jgi:hypothetical protein
VADAHGWRAAAATESDKHKVSRVELIQLGCCDAGKQAAGSPARVAGHLADAAGRVETEREVVGERGKVAAVEACEKGEMRAMSFQAWMVHGPT